MGHEDTRPPTPGARWPGVRGVPPSLHAVVVWGNPSVSDDDAHLIQELSAHVAGVVLTA
jgi:hypothetical protein